MTLVTLYCAYMVYIHCIYIVMNQITTDMKHVSAQRYRLVFMYWAE